jgi:hypothetical protein
MIIDEWVRQKYPIIIAVTIGVIISIGLVLRVTTGFSYNHDIEVWEQTGEIFAILLPVISVLPLFFMLWLRRKKESNSDARERTLALWLVSSLGGAVVIFLSSLGGLMTALYVIEDVVPFGSDYALDKFAGSLFVNQPFLYGFLLSGWRACIGFVMATLGFVLWLYSRNGFVVLIGPFCYMFVENIILSIFGVNYFRILISIDPSLGLN